MLVCSLLLHGRGQVPDLRCRLRLLWTPRSWAVRLPAATQHLLALGISGTAVQGLAAITHAGGQRREALGVQTASLAARRATSPRPPPASGDIKLRAFTSCVDRRAVLTTPILCVTVWLNLNRMFDYEHVATSFRTRLASRACPKVCYMNWLKSDFGMLCVWYGC